MKVFMTDFGDRGSESRIRCADLQPADYTKQKMQSP